MLGLERVQDGGIGEEEPGWEVVFFDDDAGRPCPRPLLTSTGPLYPRVIAMERGGLGDAAPDGGPAVAAGADRDDAGRGVAPEEEQAGVERTGGWRRVEVGVHTAMVTA